MRSLIVALLALAACGQAEVAPASNPQQVTAPLAIQEAWASPTPGGVDVSAGYLTIVNGAARDDALLSATSPRAARIEVHEMTMRDGVMQMRAVEGLAIPAGQSVDLVPNGRHLMFYGVTQPFVAGETIPVRLTFERAGVMDVSLPVRRPGASPTSHGGRH
jgi:periplasmic copper chaperone A